MSVHVEAILDTHQKTNKHNYFMSVHVEVILDTHQKTNIIIIIIYTNFLIIFN